MPQRRKNSGNDTLTDQQKAAIPALAAGKKYTEAAAEAGVSERTIYNWKKDPEFIAAISRVQSDKMGAVSAKLRDEADSALKTIIDLHEDQENPGMVRYNAAKLVLDLAFRAQEQDVLLQRIEDLEAALDAQEATA